MVRSTLSFIRTQSHTQYRGSGGDIRVTNRHRLHTYTGTTFENMKASYGVDVSKFRKSRNVWSQDAMLRDVTNATMSEDETSEINGLLAG